MGKIVFWLVVVFVVLLGLRLVNVASAKRRRDEAAAAAGRRAAAGDPMVRCARCGLYLPQAEAASSAAGYVCADGRCAERR